MQQCNMGHPRSLWSFFRVWVYLFGPFWCGNPPLCHLLPGVSLDFRRNFALFQFDSNFFWNHCLAVNNHVTKATWAVWAVSAATAISWAWCSAAAADAHPTVPSFWLSTTWRSRSKGTAKARGALPQGLTSGTSNAPEESMGMQTKYYHVLSMK